MDGFSFRIRFHLPQHHSIDYDGRELEIPTEPDQPPMRLRGHDGDGIIKSARRLVLSGGRYSSVDEATAAGRRARNALIRYSIQSRVGIDLGKDRSTGGMSKYLKDKVGAETGVQFVNDVHGLFVYDATRETRFVYADSVSLILGQPVPRFVALLQEAVRADFRLSPKQEVAFELFGAAQFEPSARTRFLTLVMAIEALLEPEHQHAAVQDHIRSLIQQTEHSQLAANDKESLVGTLRWLCKLLIL